MIIHGQTEISNTLEKINLDDLRLEEKIQFEKEGPNGTGSFGQRIKMHSEDQLMIDDLNKASLFSIEGIKQRSIYYSNFDFVENPFEKGDQIRGIPILDFDSYRAFVLFDRIIEKKVWLGILNLDNYVVSRLELNNFINFFDYSFLISENRVSMTFTPTYGIDYFGDKVIFSNQVTNALMWYDRSMDSLFYKSYNSQFTSNEKVKSYITNHGNEKSLEAEYSKFQQEINFLPPFWDDKNQVFYRFSYQELSSHSEIEEHIKSEIYLSVLDKDLNLIGEVFLAQLKKRPEKPFSINFPIHFAKDGKIWIYENINDELAFVRLSIHKEIPNK